MAYDPELDRRVALKFPFRTGDEEVRERLRQEARALARLRHRNVVQVHDVGEYKGDLFIAIEFVEGATLEDWLHTQDRSWREIVAAFVDAGRGLAAAHAAGIVHRDFKPENVLFGRDGIVKVSDFGVALPVAAPSTSGGSTSLDRQLTATDDLLGTPAYAAPEQMRLGPADPRSDQFSFCVALYEALYRRRPYAGDTPEDVLAAIEEGADVDFPASPSVPRRIKRALAIGLRPVPAERHRDLETLLAALRRRPFGAWQVGALASLAALAAWGLALRPDAAPDESYCQPGGDRFKGIWDDARKREIKRAFAATGVPYAPSSAATVSQQLDDYTKRWAERRDRLCERQSNDEADLAQLALETNCLEDRVHELNALATLFAAADRELVAGAIDAARSLKPVDECERAIAGIDLDEQARKRVADIRAKLTLARGEQDAGRFEEALALVASAEAEAEAIGQRRLQAEAETAAAALLRHVGKLDEAEQRFHEAFDHALASGDQKQLARVCVELAAFSLEAEQPQDAERWYERAAAAAGGEPDAETAANIEYGRARVAHHRGELETAHAHYREALRVREADDPTDPGIAAFKVGVAEALASLGRYEEALELLQQARDAVEAAYGRYHPRLAQPLHVMTKTLAAMGSVESAIAAGERAVDIRVGAFGEGHFALSATRVNLGLAYARAGRHAEAIAEFRKARDNYRHNFGDAHEGIATTENNLAAEYEALGDHEEAAEHYAAAHALSSKLRGAEHPRAATIEVNLGSAYVRLGRFDEAEALIRRGLGRLEAALGPEHPSLAFALLALADALRGQGRHAEAIPRIERALALRVAAKVDPVDIASTKLALAAALRSTKRDRKRAQVLDDEARRALEDAGPRGRRFVNDDRASP